MNLEMALVTAISSRMKFKPTLKPALLKMQCETATRASMILALPSKNSSNNTLPCLLACTGSATTTDMPPGPTSMVRAATGHDAASHSHALALAFLRAGTTRIRTHVDIDTDAGLKHLEGVHDTRQALAGRVEIQTVAFPQSGLLARAGTADLLDQVRELEAEGLVVDPSINAVD